MRTAGSSVCQNQNPQRSIPACAGEPLFRPLLLTLEIWSIPACAGEPYRAAQNRRKQWVYPRVCGGTNYANGGGVWSPGLSPRVRGNLAVKGGRYLYRRSIPACAGEPCCRCDVRCPQRVYPRVCGGTPPITVLLCRRVGLPRVCGGTGLEWSGAARRGGLSPRVRGNPLCALPVLIVLRSIPACAGEPNCRPPIDRIRQVYPRVCGGTIACFCVSMSP